LIRECGKPAKPFGGSVSALETHLCQVGKEVKHLPSGAAVRPLRPPDPMPTDSFSENFWEAMRQVPGGYEKGGVQPFAVCAHHWRTQTTRHTHPPPEDPGHQQRLPLDPRLVIYFFLL